MNTFAIAYWFGFAVLCACVVAVVWGIGRLIERWRE